MGRARIATSRVYPRAGGGTGSVAPVAPPVAGLSPRGRGNRESVDAAVAQRGSIPARAGEPPPPAARGARERVYPRAGGGTAVISLKPVEVSGLSPRGRGNLKTSLAIALVGGSIPARAGEPSGRPRSRRPSGVYPRAGGGTTPILSVSTALGGLSPRGRGNPSPAARGGRLPGSIPARAGEPDPPGHRAASEVVYPRAGGGTAYAPMEGSQRQGLSPRGRGNRPSILGKGSLGRSIPARAGEPVIP